MSNVTRNGFGVRKRNNEVVGWDDRRVTKAMRKAFEATEDPGEWGDELLSQLTDDVYGLASREAGGEVIDIERVQNIVEGCLIAHGRVEVARQYIHYREKRSRMRGDRKLPQDEVKRLRDDQQYFGSDLQRFQHVGKYARFNEDKNRRETKVETGDRVIDFFKWYVDNHGRSGSVDAKTWHRLEQAFLRDEASPSMRLVQMAGPAAQRCSVSIYNCSFCGISDLEFFPEMLYILMQGTGQGFSVESEFIEDLPKIKRRKRNPSSDVHTVEDSTEGWCNSLKEGLYRWYDGHDITFDYSQVRPAGARLKTKGGTASGPGPLMDLHKFTKKVIMSRQKRRLRDIDVHDIACYIGRIVQVGGVRRAAEISLSDYDSLEMRMAKHGDYWNREPQRSMSNNSAVYEWRPDDLGFLDEWIALARSGSGERGVFNRGGVWKQIPERRRKAMGRHVLWGTNPCGEIILHPDGQFCNLSIAVVRPTDTVEDLLRKVELATIFGTLQSMMTNFRYLRPQWKENCEKERLLGVDLLGAMDCPLLQPTNPDRDQLLQALKDKAVDVNRDWASRLGISPSNAVTCIKPGGNSSVRYGTGQSMTGWLSPYMKRHVRVNKIDPMNQFLIDAGVPHWPEYNDPNVNVFAFPLPAPEGAWICSDPVFDSNGEIEAVNPRFTAIEQLENWRAFKQNYTEHNPSVTIYVDHNEWVDVAQWVLANWDDLGGVSFLPYDGGVYELAPLQPVSEEAYMKFANEFPAIPWEKFPQYEATDNTEVGHEFACTGDKCMLV